MKVFRYFNSFHIPVGHVLTFVFIREGRTSSCFKSLKNVLKRNPDLICTLFSKLSVIKKDTTLTRTVKADKEWFGIIFVTDTLLQTHLHFLEYIQVFWLQILSLHLKSQIRLNLFDNHLDTIPI